MKIRWLKNRQYSPKYGTLDGEIDTKERNIPDEVARNWIDSGDAEEIKPKRATKPEKSKEE